MDRGGRISGDRLSTRARRVAGGGLIVLADVEGDPAVGRRTVGVAAVVLEEVVLVFALVSAAGGEKNGSGDDPDTLHGGLTG